MVQYYNYVITWNFGQLIGSPARYCTRLDIVFFSRLQQWPQVDSCVYDVINDSVLTKLTSSCERHQELKAVSAWHCEERLRCVCTHAHKYAHTHRVCERDDVCEMLVCAE